MRSSETKLATIKAVGLHRLRGRPVAQSKFDTDGFPFNGVALLLDQPV